MLGPLVEMHLSNLVLKGNALRISRHLSRFLAFFAWVYIAPELQQPQRASERFRKVPGGFEGPGAPEDLSSHLTQKHQQNSFEAKNSFTPPPTRNGLGCFEECTIWKTELETSNYLRVWLIWGQKILHHCSFLRKTHKHTRWLSSKQTQKSSHYTPLYPLPLLF